MMPPKIEPSRPVDAYKAIIDELATETSRSVHAEWVAKKAIFSKAPAHRAFNDFVASLSAEQRELLAGMLRDERTGAIHDVLSVLSWWVSCGGLGFTFRGQPMPVELYELGLHGDYIARIQGKQWPGNDDAAETEGRRNT